MRLLIQELAEQELTRSLLVEESEEYDEESVDEEEEYEEESVDEDEEFEPEPEFDPARGGTTWCERGGGGCC
jgi:hypothetical protein